MAYRDTQKRIPDVARELGVDALIEGSVKRAFELDAPFHRRDVALEVESYSTRVNRYRIV